MTVNGKNVEAEIDKGYAVVNDWKPGDKIELNMDMPVEIVAADERVKEDEGKRAIQRGPLVYCIEETDNADNFDSLALTSATNFRVKNEPEMLGGIKAIQASTGDRNMLFVPYYAWDNREAGKMKVWVDYND